MHGAAVHPPDPRRSLPVGPAGRDGRVRLPVAVWVSLVAVASGPLFAADPMRATSAGDSGGADRPTVERLVRRLGSGSLVERDAAARGLAALGPPALPLVTAARGHATGEAAHRLADIERRLLLQATAAASEPAVVTISVEDAAVGDVLRRIFSESGSRIEIAAAADRRLSWRCDRLTFWEAVADLLERSGLELAFQAPSVERDGKAALRIVDALPGAKPPPFNAAGPIRVSIAGSEPTGRAVGVADDDGGRRRGARIVLRVAWEPRLEPLLIRLPARSLVADGLGGESLPVAQRAAVIEAPIAPWRPWVDLPVLFAPPAVPLERLGTLRGTIVLWLKGREHAFRFADVHAGHEPAAAAPAGPQRVGQAEVRLIEARREGGRLQVRAAVAYDAASEPLSSHHAWLSERSLAAWSADGAALDLLEQRVLARTDRGITVAAEFAMPPRPPGAAAAQERDLVVEWTLPIAIHELPVDFAIRDVPLPQPR